MADEGLGMLIADEGLEFGDDVYAEAGEDGRYRARCGDCALNPASPVCSSSPASSVSAGSTTVTLNAE